jgi:uncharacterized protein (DUF2345 family)
MALIPSSRYPAQTDSDAAYPHGKARNAGSYQDGTGTPLDKDLVNDIFGFQQALLDAADITPSGDPDEVGASQYLEAVQTITSRVRDGETFTVEEGGIVQLNSGADVNVASGAEVNVSGAVNIDPGGHIDVDSGGNINLASGSDLNVASGGDINVVTGGEINVTGVVNIDPGGVMAVDGSINLASGAAINVNNGARIDVNTGGEIQFNAGSTLDVNVSSDFAGGTTMAMHGSIAVTSGGSINVTSADVNINSGAQIQLNGGALIVGATGYIQANGGDITLGPGSLLTMEAGANLRINDAAEGFRLTLTPAFHEVFGQWEKTSNSSGTLGWVQTNVGDDRSIWFALPVNPGDTVVDVYVRVEAEDHPGGMPAFDDMPVVELISVDLNGVISVPHATKVDNSATEPAYDGLHDIVLQAGTTDTGTMPYVATADPIYIRLRGEKGGSAVTGLCLRSISGNLIARSYRAANMVR